MWIEQQVSQELNSKIELDSLVTIKEREALKKALETDHNIVISLAQIQEGELKNFLIQEYGQLSYNLVGKRGIKTFQNALGIKADGVYGPQTFEKIVQYQVENWLKVDGIIGPETLGKIKWTPQKSVQNNETPQSQNETIQYNFDIIKAIETLDSNYSIGQKRTIAKLLWLWANANSEDIVKSLALFQHITGKPLKVNGILDTKTYDALQIAQNQDRSTPMSEHDIGKVNKNLKRAEKIQNLEIPEKWNIIFKEFFLHAKNKQEQKEILSGKYPIALTDTRTGRWIIIMGKSTVEFPVSYSKNGKFAKWPTQWDNAVNYGFIEHFTSGKPYKYGGMKIEVAESLTVLPGRNEPSVKWWHAAAGDGKNGLRNTIGCKWLPPEIAKTLATYVNKAWKGFWYASRT